MSKKLYKKLRANAKILKANEDSFIPLYYEDMPPETLQEED